MGTIRSLRELYEPLSDGKQGEETPPHSYNHRVTERNVSLNVRSMQRLHEQLSERNIDRNRSFFRNRSIFGLPTFDPRWKPYKRWVKVIYMIDILYTGVLMPIFMAYDTQLRWHTGTVVDVIAGCFFFADLILGFHAGYVLQWQGEKFCVMDGWDIAKYYITQAGCWLNIFFLIPLITQVVMMAAHLEAKEWVIVLVWLRTARPIRIFYIIKQMTTGQVFGSIKTLHRMGVEYETARPIILLFSGFVLFNMLSCLWIAIANEEGGGPTWLDGPNGVGSDAPFGRKYLMAMYFIMTTVLTVGYGDISAATDAERLAGIATMVLGCAYMAYILGSVVEMVASAGKAGRRAAVFHQKAAILQNFLDLVNPIDKRLEHQLFSYYADVWAREQEEEELLESVLRELPRALRSEVAFAMVGDDLRAVDAFADLDDEALKQLVVELQVDFVLEDRVILTEGEVLDSVFFLQDGVVAVSQNLKVITEVDRLALLGSPNLFDHEGQLRLDAPAQYSLTSVSACLIWRVPLLRLQCFLGRYTELRAGVEAELLDSMGRQGQDSGDAGSETLGSPQPGVSSPPGLQRSMSTLPRGLFGPSVGRSITMSTSGALNRSRTLLRLSHEQLPPGLHSYPMVAVSEDPSLEPAASRSLAFDKHRMTFRVRS